MLIYKKQQCVFFTKNLLIFLFIIIFPFFLHSLFPDYFKFPARLMVSTYNIANKWNYEFQYLNGEVQGWFIAKSDDAQLVYSVSLESGNIQFQLYNSKSNIITFSESNTIDTFSGFFKKGEKYRIYVNAQQATNGNFRFEMK